MSLAETHCTFPTKRLEPDRFLTMETSPRPSIVFWRSQILKIILVQPLQRVLFRRCHAYALLTATIPPSQRSSSRNPTPGRITTQGKRGRELGPIRQNYRGEQMANISSILFSDASSPGNQQRKTQRGRTCCASPAPFCNAVIRA